MSSKVKKHKKGEDALLGAVEDGAKSAAIVKKLQGLENGTVEEREEFCGHIKDFAEECLTCV